MEASNNTETEDETIALKKKRARRVSFADKEVTSVHIFRRDDDESSGTPQESLPSPQTNPSPEVLGFFRDLASDSDDDDNHGSDSFLKPIGSPSPGGSSTAASSTDGEFEDDFDGPVSASFIRPERLSDSGASDDVTMDSTAFSLHYRSLARSDSSGDLKTLTGFEEKTASQTCSPPGSSMVLTKAKKQSSEFDAASGCRDSNDMSIVGENPPIYDYDKLSPALDAILAEGSKDFPAVTQASIHHRIQTPHSIKKNQEFVNDPIVVPLHKQLDIGNANRGTPLKVNGSSPKDIGQVIDTNNKSGCGQVNGDPIHSFTPLASAGGRRQLFMASPDSSRYAGTITPSLRVEPGLLVPDIDDATRGETLSSMRKSITKLKSLETTTPILSATKEGLDRLKCRLSKYSPGSSLFNKKDGEYKQDKTPNVSFEEQQCTLSAQNNMHLGLINTNYHGIESLRNISNLSQHKETVDMVAGDVSYIDRNSKPVETEAAPSQITHLARVIDFDLADSVVENRKDEVVNISVTHDKPFPSPVKLLHQNLPPPTMENQRNCCDDELKQLDKLIESAKSGLGQDVECNTDKVANRLGLSCFELNEKPSSPSEIAQVNKVSKSASKRKLAESPANRVPVLTNSPMQEATTLSPSLHELPSDSRDNNMPHLSNKGNLDSRCPLDKISSPAIQVTQNPLTISGVEVSSGKKRKGVKLLYDGGNIDKMGRMVKSQVGHQSGNSGGAQSVLEETGYNMQCEREEIGDQTWNDLTDILKRFLGNTQQLLSSSVVDKLNLRMIGMLEDTLVHLQKVKQSEIICLEIHSQQKITDPLDVLRRKRVVEARMLLFNVAFEKAKLHLLHIKHERLREKVQKVRLGLQETQMMMKSLKCSSKSGLGDAQANDSHIQTSLPNSDGKCQGSCEKVSTLRQELGTLDSKAESVREFFCSRCMMMEEGGQNYGDTIKSVHDYLRNRMSHKFIFQNLKLWDIEDFEHKDRCYRVMLNYCNYIIQRFTVKNAGGQNSITISNSLNDVNIIKTFPDMDAVSAFLFVLNHLHMTQNCTGSICLPQEAQITSSLLGNLLDVVEEVQLSRMEIRNLVQAKFYSHSVQQLDLQLVFMDFGSGRKVKVTLDVTCLKCGVYPVELLPSQIQHDDVNGILEQKTLPSPLVCEINTAAQSVRVGYSRIIRLCRRISQTLQTFTQSRR